MYVNCCKNIVRISIITCLFFTGCISDKKELLLFEALESRKTGLEFTNKLSYTKDFNLFKYMYFYNGSGIGAGDFNNDGLIDLFFASNQNADKLYLNTGKLKFKDVTDEAKIPVDSSWSTGVSVVDINNDGLLDIYVCRVGEFETLHSKNQFLINQGISKDGVPVFTDKAKEYGLDFKGFSTQSAFFDYDNDGDLDMLLINHSMRENGSFVAKSDFKKRFNELSGDRLYRNDGNVFTEVKDAGITASMGYGLGIAISDVNLDGFPDIYIGNDFQENDYLYLNQHNGTFKEDADSATMHTSQFSMGVDVADVNNDAWPEIISVDMLPSDPYMLKRSLGEDAYDVFNYKINYGYAYQYSRNNLQYNRRNGVFSELGLYSNVYNTDWSWAPLWMDFDNDGLKDLFVSNGIPKRLNDIDYINFYSSEDVQVELRYNNLSEVHMSLIQKFPEIKLPNRFFKNNGNLQFKDEESRIGNNTPTFSNGAVYADLDNDGDLDIVVNNIDNPVILYENQSPDSTRQSSLKVKLNGPSTNVNAIGARIIVYSKGQIRTYEKFGARGFLSSMETPLHIGLAGTQVDSMILVWSDNSCQRIDDYSSNKNLTISYKPDLPVFDFGKLRSSYELKTKPVKDITSQTSIDYKHEENKFIEFNREPLIPHMVSSEGPALATGDINQDGLDDIFIGSARDKKPAVFMQTAAGKFLRSNQPALNADSAFEDIDAKLIDVNNDKWPDLVVASGGNEFFGNDKHNSPRVYLNNGRGEFVRKDDAFNGVFMTASCIEQHDFNGDGFIDLFIGGRAVPAEYGKIPRSYLFLNDKTGGFKDVTEQYSKELGNTGFVTGAQWIDLDKDGDNDLVLSLEWGGIKLYTNNKDHFTESLLTDKKGWWNFVYPCDIDNDGDIDLVAGNLGLNSRLKASDKEPVRMYYNDFDDNEKKEQLLTYYLAGREIPFANKFELERQLPLIKKKFLYAADFAKASLSDLFGADKLKQSEIYQADYFSNAILVNTGNGKFETRALPWEAQLSPMQNAITVDANGDNLPDLLTFGNYYDNNIAMGRYDADYGTLLINRGNGIFSPEVMNGMVVRGQVRRTRAINIGKKQAFILARNNDPTIIIQF